MDGTRLLSQQSYEKTKSFAGLTDSDVAKRFESVV